MPPIRRRQILDEEWKKHETVIRGLYVQEDRTAEEVMGIMKDRYEFDASKNQYGRQFTRWGMRKNLTQEDWQMIGDYLTRKGGPDISASVYFHDKLMPAKTVNKETARYRNQPRPDGYVSGMVPSGVRVELNVPEVLQLAKPASQAEDRPATLAVPTTAHSLVRSSFPENTTNLVSPHWDFLLEDMEGNTTTWSDELERFDSMISMTGYPSPIFNSMDDIMSDGFQLKSNIALPKDTLSLFLKLSLLLPNHLAGVSTGILGHIPILTAVTSRDLRRFLQAQDFHAAFLHLILHLLINSLSLSGIKPEILQKFFDQFGKFATTDIHRFLDDVPQPYSIPLEVNLLKSSIDYGATSLFKTLWERQCKSSHSKITDLMESACLQRRVDIVRILLASVDNVDDVPPNIWHSLFSTSHRGTLPISAYEIQRLLLQAGVPMSLDRNLRWEDDAWVAVLLEYGKPHTAQYIRAFDIHELQPVIQMRSDEEATKAFGLFLGLRFKLATNMEPSMFSHALHTAAFGGKRNIFEFLRLAGVPLGSSCLVAAVQGGAIEMIDYLLSAGFGPNDLFETPCFSCGHHAGELLRHRFPTTPLAESIRYRRERIYERFCTRGALEYFLGNAQSSMESFDAALGAASEVGNSSLVTQLLTCLPYKQSHTVLPGAKCLTLAAHGGNHAIIDTLLEIGVQPAWSEISEIGIPTSSPEVVRLFLDMGCFLDHRNSYTLRSAVEQGMLDTVQDLIISGAPLNGDQLFAGTSPLFEAIRANNEQMIDLLLRHGARIDNSVPWSGNSNALHRALNCDDENLVRSLLSYGAKATDSSLLAAVEKSSYSMTKIILDALVETGSREKRKSTVGAAALSSAVKAGNIPIIRLLAPYTDVNFIARDISSDDVAIHLSPFGMAIESRNVQIIQILILSGGLASGTVGLDIDNKRVGRRTALLQAIDTGDLQVVKQIRTEGAEVNCPPILGIIRIPLQLAAEKGSLEIVEYLIEEGAEVNAASSIYGGGTALQLAAIKGWRGIVEFLVEKGADINAPRGRYQGRTAFEGAAEWGRLDVLLFLFHHGVDLVSDGGTQIEKAKQLADSNNQPAAKSWVEQISVEIALRQDLLPTGSTLGTVLIVGT